jgi:hypothetical protein
MIIIIMRGENLVAYLDGLGGTSVCRGTPVAYHWFIMIEGFGIQYSKGDTVMIFRVL